MHTHTNNIYTQLCVFSHTPLCASQRGDSESRSIYKKKESHTHTHTHTCTHTTHTHTHTSVHTHTYTHNCVYSATAPLCASQRADLESRSVCRKKESHTHTHTHTHTYTHKRKRTYIYTHPCAFSHSTIVCIAAWRLEVTVCV